MPSTPHWGQRITELEGLKIRSCITLKPRAVLEPTPRRGTLMWLSLHFSAYDRRMHDAGRCWYLPVNLGEIPDYYRRFNAPVDIAVIRTRADGRERLLQLQPRRTCGCAPWWSGRAW